MLLDSLPKRVSKERNEYYLYDDYVESEHKKGKALSTIYKEIQMMGFRGSPSPFYYHYRYLSDGRRGYKSKQKVKEVQKRAAKVMALKREPLVPIHQIAHAVEKSLRAMVLYSRPLKSPFLRDIVLTQYLANFLKHATKSFHSSFEFIGLCHQKHVHSISNHTLIYKSCGLIGNLTLSDLLSVLYLHACRRVYVFSVSDNGCLIAWVRES